MGSGAEISPSGFNAIRQYTDCPLPCHRPDMMPSLRNPTYKAIRELNRLLKAAYQEDSNEMA
jgi:hypothetical protein